ncbi:MAG: flagellar hook-length control protein FliK, partial [Firmicutes bacterium]|nr:flagellar hook-length control protein FliK [Bacillota bacterium]
QELRLRLQPESLGEVLVRIRRQQGVLSAEIMTRHPAVQEMLESQLETLRQRFQEANLPVEHLDVLLQDEGKSGFTFSGEGRGRDQPRAFAAGTGAGNAAGERENLAPGRRGAGCKVDCLV